MYYVKLLMAILVLLVLVTNKNVFQKQCQKYIILIIKCCIFVQWLTEMFALQVYELFMDLHNLIVRWH